MGILCKNFTSQKTFSYAKSVIKTPMRHQSNAIDIIVVSLLLNWKYVIHYFSVPCWLCTSKCSLE